MALFINKILAKEELLPAEIEGYFSRGIRHQVWLNEGITAAQRGVEMLVNKLNNKPYETELVIPNKEKVRVANALTDLSKAKIAILNTGGIVPIDNPDKIQSASATRWGRYNIENIDKLEGGKFKTIHAGFDPSAADKDPNVIVPIDVMKDLLKEKRYGSLHPYFYSTVGTGTTQAEASRMGKEILKCLQEDGVDAVIMVST